MAAPKVPDIGIDKRIFTNLAKKAKFMFSFDGNIHHVLPDGRSCYFDKKTGNYCLQTSSTEVRVDELIQGLYESEAKLSESFRSLAKSLNLLAIDIGIAPSDTMNQIELDLDLENIRNRRNRR